MKKPKKRFFATVCAVMLGAGVAFAYTGSGARAAKTAGVAPFFVVSAEAAGETPSAATFRAENGTAATNTKPLNPKFKDYVFGGWYTDLADETTRLPDSSSGLAGQTYYARWLKNGKTVTTEPLDLSAASEDADCIETFGYRWAKEDKTLELNGFRYDGAGAFAVRLPDGANLKIEGENSVIWSVTGDTDGAAVLGVKKLKISGNGAITVNADGNGSNSVSALYVAGDCDIGSTGDEETIIGTGSVTGGIFGGDETKKEEKSAPKIDLFADNGGETIAFRCGKLNLRDGFITATAGTAKDMEKASVGFRSKTLVLNGGILTARAQTSAFITDVLPVIGQGGRITTTGQDGKEQSVDAFSEGIDGELYGEATTVCALKIGERPAKSGKISLHMHVFDRRVESEKYLIEEATCQHGTIYYVSCVCGERGMEAFELGDIMPHVDLDGDEKCDLCGTKIKQPLSAGEITAISLASAAAVLLALYVLGYFFLYRKGKLEGETSEVIYKFLPKEKKKE